MPGSISNDRKWHDILWTSSAGKKYFKSPGIMHSTKGGSKITELRSIATSNPQMSGFIQKKRLDLFSIQSNSPRGDETSKETDSFQGWVFAQLDVLGKGWFCKRGALSTLMSDLQDPSLYLHLPPVLLLLSIFPSIFLV